MNAKALVEIFVPEVSLRCGCYQAVSVVVYHQIVDPNNWVAFSEHMVPYYSWWYLLDCYRKVACLVYILPADFEMIPQTPSTLLQNDCSFDNRQQDWQVDDHEIPAYHAAD